MIYFFKIGGNVDQSRTVVQTEISPKLIDALQNDELLTGNPLTFPVTPP